MRRLAPAIFLITFGLIFTLNALGQTRLFEKYRFEDGGYMLIGVRSESDKNALAESLGDFYTKDIAVLNAVKKAWVFRRRSPMYACGYHYEVILLKDGKEVQSHGINLNFHELTTDNGSMYFEPKLLEMFKDRLQKLRVSQDEFASISDGRKFWTMIHSDKRFIYADAPKWLKYEGSFGFVYKCPDGCKDFTKRDKYTEQVRSQIAKAYPGNEFELRDDGGTSDGEIFFQIQSTEAFYKGFTIFPIDPTSYFHGQWKPFSSSLTSYWKP